MASAAAVAFSAVLIAAPVASKAQTALTIESWRNDDIDIWNDKIIPAFNKKHPDIKVVFSPTPPADYNASLNAKLSGGTAGDLIIWNDALTNNRLGTFVSEKLQEPATLSSGSAPG